MSLRAIVLAGALSGCVTHTSMASFAVMSTGNHDDIYTSCGIEGPCWDRGGGTGDDKILLGAVLAGFAAVVVMNYLLLN